ncbi:Ntn hydrolase family protein [Novisyntrophococcus fermenticellae]|uniref:hypothetical protein n=1 Tax=Novisyntrophococcus fermenticellae TaxID=2068655 RepID=UPI001E39D9B5|nr:hypothetical protein [Novisyntrophococcus fermenticellae]
MSVIFGIREEKRIVLAADKRTSLITGHKVSDEQEKIFEVNKKVAVTCGGNVAIETAIKMEINKQVNKSTMTTDDLVSIIDKFYKNLVEKKCDSIYSHTFYCLIAGTGQDGKSHLVNAGRFQTGFSANEVPAALYQPADADQKECNEIFAKNYYTHHNEFCERTIQEISQISELVSPNGNKWVYNIEDAMGLMYEF